MPRRVSWNSKQDCKCIPGSGTFCVNMENSYSTSTAEETWTRTGRIELSSSVNLNFLSKVLEKVALQQFNEHCRTFNLLPDHQSAYRQYCSCETALIKIVNDILWHVEGQEVTAMACIDLSAAFDTVDHGTLEKVLRVIRNHWQSAQLVLLVSSAKRLYGERW